MLPLPPPTPRASSCAVLAHAASPTSIPEELFDFRETRPTVRIDARGNREVNWPANEFFYARNPRPHDVVIAIGTEPGLRWRTFAASYGKLFTTSVSN